MDRDGLKIQESKEKAKSKDGNLEERYTRGQGHDAAFMAPMPLMYGYGSPYVYPSYLEPSAFVIPVHWYTRSVWRLTFNNFRVYPDVLETKARY